MQTHPSVIPAGKPLDVVLESREEPVHPSIVTSLSGEPPPVDTDWLLKRGFTSSSLYARTPLPPLSVTNYARSVTPRRWEFWEKKVSQALHAGTVPRLTGQGGHGRVSPNGRTVCKSLFLRNAISNTAIKAALAVGTFSENAPRLVADQTLTPALRRPLF